jgi:rhodanese-related sulfurtransferase
MSSINSISADRLVRLIGTPKCPVLVDVRPDDDFAEDPRLLPGSTCRRYEAVDDWATDLHGRSTVVICRDGSRECRGVAAVLRDAGVAAESLDDGFAGWIRNGLPLIPTSKLPHRNGQGRTLWVTRERPKIDRIACPWLIRRFVDPAALFMFVAPYGVAEVAGKFSAAPFDVEGVFWSHRGEACTFDVMIEEFGLRSAALLRLATIVRAADTARLDLAPEAAGLLAASLGLSRMYVDDLEQLEAGLGLYDAFYRWCRDATNETHDWPTSKKGT